MFNRKKIKRLQAEAHEKDMRIARQETIICNLLEDAAQSRERLRSAQARLNNPPHYRPDEKIGSIRILEIKPMEEVNFALIGGAAVIATIAISATAAALFKRPFYVPDLPKKQTWHYRYRDERSGQEGELSEIQFKKMVSEKIYL